MVKQFKLTSEMLKGMIRTPRMFNSEVPVGHYDFVDSELKDYKDREGNDVEYFIFYVRNRKTEAQFTFASFAVRSFITSSGTSVISALDSTKDVIFKSGFEVKSCSPIGQTAAPKNEEVTKEYYLNAYKNYIAKQKEYTEAMAADERDYALLNSLRAQIKADGPLDINDKTYQRELVIDGLFEPQDIVKELTPAQKRAATMAKNKAEKEAETASV